MINRNLLKTLREWRNSSPHKPILLRGARQVGKSWLIRQFGKEFNAYPKSVPNNQ